MSDDCRDVNGCGTATVCYGKRMPNYSDLEMAFYYVGDAPYGTNRAVYDKSADRFLYASAITGESEITDDLDWPHCYEVPHKNTLDLGRDLVFRFIEEQLPDEAATVQRIFQRAGAYGRFKEFLEDRRQLQAWYDFEAAARRSAIEQWCRDNGLDIIDDE
jgi:hypothetical protein